VTGVTAEGLRVAVVGAGIAGLATAVGLVRSGAAVTVFEEAPAVRSEGSGLTVFAGGLRALDALGLGARFRALTDGDVRLLRGGQRAPGGRWLARIPTDAVAEMRVVDRGDFHRMLLDSLGPAASIRTRTRIDAADPDGTVRWTTADGLPQEETFDLVVGADGMRSQVRTAFPDDPGRRYAGYGAWRGITRGPVDLGGEAGETWGVRTRFGIAPLADGRVYWFAVATMPEEAVFHDETAVLESLFGRWHDPIPEILSATDSTAVHRLPIFELAGDLATYVRGRIVLVGDAAHAMAPNLGQGGGQGLEDAAQLCASLADAPTDVLPQGGDTAPVDGVATALASYDALRRPRSQRIARMSRLIGDAAHLPGPRLTRVRDAILGLTPESALRSRIRQVQEWDGPGVHVR
jgi:2-polyprenyl-6-methoxyphenol hydroxylase-like FAD-dependent oxidoreductase